jgi:hypothetical protein
MNTLLGFCVALVWILLIPFVNFFSSYLLLALLFPLTQRDAQGNWVRRSPQSNPGHAKLARRLGLLVALLWPLSLPVGFTAILIVGLRTRLLRARSPEGPS